MQKIYIYITFPIFSFFYFSLSSAYASATPNSETRGGISGAHSEHPPHDHQEVDHLKYIRTRDEKKKKPL